MTTQALTYLAAQEWALHRQTLDQTIVLLESHAAGVRSGRRDLDALEVAAGHRRGHSRRVRRDLDIAGYDGLEHVCPGSDPDDREPFIVAGANTIVPIHGMIAKYAGMVYGISGPEGISSNRLVRCLTDAICLRSTQRLILDIDSPGGTIAGSEDVLEVLRRNREGRIRPDGARIPVIAFAHDMCASLAYLFSAWADQIVCGASSKVGCLGVYSVVEDSSAAATEAGIRRTVVASRPAGGKTVKGMGEPGTPVTDDMLGALQSQTDATGRWFARSIAEGRQVGVETIEPLCDGRAYVGEDAVEIGLADAVATLPELLDQLGTDTN